MSNLKIIKKDVYLFDKNKLVTKLHTRYILSGYNVLDGSEVEQKQIVYGLYTLRMPDICSIFGISCTITVN